MTDIVLNRSLLPGNACFGCGHENHAGLQIEIRRHPAAEGRLIGSFNPAAHMTGFPGIVHGGALYTALDCLATWVATVMRPEKPVVWILRSAEVTYHRVAREGQEIALEGAISVAGRMWRPVVVRTQARDRDGELLAEGYFKEVPLDVDRFKKAAGVGAIPATWSRFLDGAANDERGADRDIEAG